MVFPRHQLYGWAPNALAVSKPKWRGGFQCLDKWFRTSNDFANVEIWGLLRVFVPSLKKDGVLYKGAIYSRL